MAKKNEEYALKDPVTGSVVTMDYASSDERSARDELLNSFRDSPIPDHSVLANLGLHLTSKTFSRLLFMNEFYKMGLDVMGQVAFHEATRKLPPETAHPLRARRVAHRRMAQRNTGNKNSPKSAPRKTPVS